jgi:hypothetical protein
MSIPASPMIDGKDPLTEREIVFLRKLMANPEGELFESVEKGVAAAIESQIPAIIAALEPVLQQAVAEADKETGPEFSRLVKESMERALEPILKRITRLEAALFRYQGGR